MILEVWPVGIRSKLLQVGFRVRGLHFDMHPRRYEAVVSNIPNLDVG
jgi:hypothetical protein